MKKTIFFALGIILAVSLLSCTSTQSVRQSDPSSASTTSKPVPSAPLEDLFLISTSESESVVADRSTEFRSASAHGIGLSSRRIELDQLKQTSKSPFASGEDFVYKYSETKANSDLDASNGTFYSQYDTYFNDTGWVEYLSNSDIIAFYSGHGDARGQQKCTEEELLKSANAFIQKCIPADAFVKYTYCGMDTDVWGMTVLEYTRYIESYATDDSLLVFFADDGSIMGYNGRNACKYDAVTTELTKQKLDDATAKLTQKIDALELDILTRGDPVLTTNTSGEVFIEIWIRYDVTTESEGIPITDTVTDSLYVRVN